MSEMKQLTRQAVRGNPTLTKELGRKGNKKWALNRRKLMRLRQRELDIAEREQWISLLREMFKSPVWAGGSFFLFLTAIESMISGLSGTSPQQVLSQLQSSSVGKQNPFLNAFLGYANQFFSLLQLTPVGAVGETIDQAATSSNPGAFISFETMKFATVLYVATGGNLAGLLNSQSLSSIAASMGLSGVIPK